MVGLVPSAGAVEFRQVHRSILGVGGKGGMVHPGKLEDCKFFIASLWMDQADSTGVTL